ncbi:33299_t:CDS:2, partial [Gigaspora margarita]
ENVYTHVIITGKNRGMSGTRLIRNKSCARPNVLIYINDPEIAASQSNNHITKIATPIEHTKHLMWLTDLSFESLKNWNTPKIHLQIITQNRPESLTHLIKSLNSSIYIGDDVSLTINMDRGADPVTLKFSQTMDFWSKKWLCNLLTAVVESYYPADDVELSLFITYGQNMPLPFNPTLNLRGPYLSQAPCI